MAKARGSVEFKDDICKGCSLCIPVCPVDIISLDQAKINKKGYHPAGVKEGEMEKCIGCAFCAQMCPDLVITVHREK